MGLPDLGITTIDDVCFHIRQCWQAADLPILVDGDTGTIIADASTLRGSWSGTRRKDAFAAARAGMTPFDPGPW